MQIGVINSDRRQSAIAEQLQSYGIEVVLIGCEEDIIDELEVLILPIKGCNERYEVLLNTGILQLEKYCDHNPNVKLFTGIYNPWLEQLPVQVVYLMEIEEVVLKNAILTAQGILAEVIRHIDIPLKQLKVDVIGYGRCGREIVDLLSNITSHVRLVVKRERVIEIQEKISNEVISYEDWSYITPSNLIINTAPSVVLTAEIVDRWNISPIILDIATSPGGVDYPYAAKKNINAILLPSLPSKYSPSSAGIILADAIYKELI